MDIASPNSITQFPINEYLVNWSYIYYEGSGQFCVVTVSNFKPLDSCVGGSNCFTILSGKVNVCKDQQGM